MLDYECKATPPLDVVKDGKVARLTKEEFQKERDKMIAVCAKCHSQTYAKDQLQAADMVIKDADKIMAEAIREVQNLYKEGVRMTLMNPCGQRGGFVFSRNIR